MSDTLDLLLAGAIRPGVYRWASRHSTARLAARAERSDWRSFVLAGRDLADKDALLGALADTLGFPAYDGRNWDALLDLLRDLSWAPTQRGWLLIWDNVRHLGARAPRDLAVALDVLRDAAAFWGDTDTPLTVLLRAAGRSVQSVPLLRG